MKINSNIYQLIEELYPITRSITGEGVVQTLETIQKHIPLKNYTVASGTKVFDWTVPDEWNIKDAYVKDSKGNKVIDFKKNNLHIVNYSSPIKAKMFLETIMLQRFGTR